MEIVAVVTVADAHVAVAVTSWVVPSEYFPVATKVSFVALAIFAVAGVTAIDTKLAAVTVSVVLPTMAPLVAEISVVPAARVVACPKEPAAFDIVAVAGVAEAHVTVAERS